MTHDQIKDNLSDYIDGQLSANEQLEMETHLQTCSDCKQSVVFLKSVPQVLATRSSAVGSDVFVEKTMNRIRMEEMPSQSWMRFIRPFFHGIYPDIVFAGAAVVGLIAIFVFKPEPKYATYTEAKNEIVYVSELMEGPYQDLTPESPTIGTTIEEYFL